MSARPDHDRDLEPEDPINSITPRKKARGGLEADSVGTLRLKWIEHALVDHELSHTAHRVGCVIAYAINQKTRTAFPHIKTIAKRINISEQTTIDAIKQLVARGHIIKGKKGAKNNNEYSLAFGTVSESEPTKQKPARQKPTVKGEVLDLAITLPEAPRPIPDSKAAPSAETGSVVQMRPVRKPALHIQSREMAEFEGNFAARYPKGRYTYRTDWVREVLSRALSAGESKDHILRGAAVYQRACAAGAIEVIDPVHWVRDRRWKESIKG